LLRITLVPSPGIDRVAATFAEDAALGAHRENKYIPLIPDIGISQKMLTNGIDL
jgi:hypothetical protein